MHVDAEARITGRPHLKRSTPIGKFWIERWVWAAQYASAGTSMEPIESFSVLVLMLMARKGSRLFAARPPLAITQA